jgi:hypothetical protein
MSRSPKEGRDRWAEPDEARPVDEVEWEPRGDPAEEPFRTLLGESGSPPEAEYEPLQHDATGTEGLWRAVEHLAGERDEPPKSRPEDHVELTHRPAAPDHGAGR